MQQFWLKFELDSSITLSILIILSLLHLPKTRSLSDSCYINFYHWLDMNASNTQNWTKILSTVQGFTHNFCFYSYTQRQNKEYNPEFLLNSTHFCLKKWNKNWSWFAPKEGHKIHQKTFLAVGWHLGVDS